MSYFILLYLNHSVNICVVIYILSSYLYIGTQAPHKFSCHHLHKKLPETNQIRSKPMPRHQVSCKPFLQSPETKPSKIQTFQVPVIQAFLRHECTRCFSSYYFKTLSRTSRAPKTFRRAFNFLPEDSDNI